MHLKRLFMKEWHVDQTNDNTSDRNDTLINIRFMTARSANAFNRAVDEHYASSSSTKKWIFK